MSDGGSNEASTNVSSSHVALKIQPGSWRDRKPGETPDRKPRDASALDDSRAPWSPVGHATSPRAFSKLTNEASFTPVITEKARRLKRESGKMFTDSLRHEAQKQETRRRAHQMEITGLFHPKINRARSGSPQGRVFDRLYQRRSKEVSQTKIAHHLQKERDACTGTPKINQSSLKLDRNPELRLRWNDAKVKNLEALREEQQRKEVEGVRDSPMLNLKSLEMASRREGRIEDRLIGIGERMKHDRNEVLKNEALKYKEDASPHISAHAAMSACPGPAHERLYSSGVRKLEKAVSEAPSDESCTFAPSISKRSHILAGGDLPKHEKIEDRLLRQGSELKQRNEEHNHFLDRLDSEQRSGRHHVGPLSKLLNDLAEQNGRKSSYTDPTGINNKRTSRALSKKHPDQHAFKPYIGSNSRAIDKQMHGDRSLSWGERIGNLYYKQQEKENKLTRMRGQKEEEENLRCKALVGTAERKAQVAREIGEKGGDLHSRNKAWKQRLENKRRWGRHHKEEEEVKECTFKPSINRSSSLRSTGSGRDRKRVAGRGSAHSLPPTKDRHPQPQQPVMAFADQESQKEHARHHIISQHIRHQLSSPPHSPQTPLRATSLASACYTEPEDEQSDRLLLLQQLEQHRRDIEQEELRRT